MKIESIAALKRYLQPGRKIRLVYRHATACSMDEIREVAVAKSNSIGFSHRDSVSWLDYAKAANYRWLDDGFEVWFYSSQVKEDVLWMRFQYMEED